MSGLNKVMLIGRLGKDPETKTFDNGGSICTFSIATSETFKDKTTGEKKETNEWHNVVMQNELGKVAQKYLQKGAQVYVEGKLRTRQYTAKDNSTKYITEVLGLGMTLLGSKADSGSNSAASSQQKSAPAAQTNQVESDDLPF